MTFWYLGLEVLFLESFPDAELWEQRCGLEDTERFWS